MKKMLYFVPVVLFLLFTILGNSLFASHSIHPAVLVMGLFFVGASLMLFRPRQNKKNVSASDMEADIRGTFAKDAFADDAKRNAKFQSALKDYAGNMPKAAMGKLNALAPLCRNDPEKYAVAVASAKVQSTLRKYPEAARQYTSALVLHPTTDLAMEQGSCFQRIGELKKARSAYLYALDLDSSNLEAISAIATTYVAEQNYESALEEAQKVLEKDETHASALATTAICYGLLNDPLLSKHFTDRAVASGYSANKIKDTISALK